MGIRSVLVALLGVAVAGGSAYGAREYLDQSRATAATDAGAALVSVVVAGRDIPFGQPIQPQILQVMSWPRAALPPGAITDLDALIPKPGMPPRRATHEMAQGELVLASKVSNFGEKVTIVQTLGENARAMAIRVDAETAVGGFVTPGDAVDIVLTQGKDASLRAVTILQNIRVLGVDQQADQQSDQPLVARTVTVEVTPEQSQTLALAQKAGTLSLSLRSLDNAEDKPLESIRLSDILRETSPVEEPVAAKATVRIRRGAEVEVVEVE
ncbi:Flp pilus assembly protein CpaB [Albidovulum sp.]|uniref:Flp pilus assembly protein CpaB n=1 Tax=Albidovulum sp. TaxID=1872424 RepID=UPI0039B93D58